MKYRNKLIVLMLGNVLLILTSIQCSAVSQDASAIEERTLTFGPAVQLFNGKDLEGWTAYFQDGSQDPSKAFSVRDGYMVCAGNPIGYVQTEAKYESYQLVIEWRFDPAKGAGNSGVLLRVTGPDVVWPRSLEAQLHSGNAGDIWNIGKVPGSFAKSRTDGRRTKKAHSANEKPLGEWNQYTITFDEGNLTLDVNGVVQNTATKCQVLPGRIGLQSEGSWIEFRRVELRPIVGRDASPGVSKEVPVSTE